MTWNEAWGDPSDYNVQPGVTEHEGFTVGDRVVALDDDDEGLFFHEDEGVVAGVAFTKGGLFNPNDRWELVVKFDESEALACIEDPYEKVEKI